jgi:putative hydrolase of the HAD superfamily
VSSWIEGVKEILYPWKESDAGEYMKHRDKNIDAVLFDFGGVIAEDGFKHGLTVIAKANGLDERTFFQAAFDTIYSTGYLVGKATESTFGNTLRQRTGVKGDDASLRNEIFSRFILRDWMIDLVKKLKANELKVGILSDQTDMLDRLDKKYNFFRLFDYIFNSYYMGKGKRDSSLFDDIVKVLRTDPNRVLFIDDNSKNVNRAKQKGWKGIQYVDRDSFQRDIDEILPLKSSNANN